MEPYCKCFCHYFHPSFSGATLTLAGQEADRWSLSTGTVVFTTVSFSMNFSTLWASTMSRPGVTGTSMWESTLKISTNVSCVSFLYFFTWICSLELLFWTCWQEHVDKTENWKIRNNQHEFWMYVYSYFGRNGFQLSETIHQQPEHSIWLLLCDALWEVRKWHPVKNNSLLLCCLLCYQMDILFKITDCHVLL